MGTYGARVGRGGAVRQAPARSSPSSSVCYRPRRSCPKPGEQRPSGEVRLWLYMQSEAVRRPRLTLEWRENGCKVLVLAVLVLQNSSLVLATTYARQREGELFLTTVLVFLGECIKTSVSVLCTVMTSGTSTGRVLHTSFVTEAHSLWRMAVPAVLYTFSNNLALVAMSNLSAVAYQVANQLKIPATALMARLLLQRRISSVQWCVILLLVLGVILVQLKPDAPPTGRETHTMLGLAAVIANAVVGAFAGVWFEKIVKATRPDGRTTNLWVSNLQAASYNACIRASHGAGCVTYDCPACCLPFAALPLLTAAFCRCRAAHRLHRGPRWHGAARLRQCRLLGSCTHDVFCAYCACGVLRRIHSVACVPRCAAAARPKPDTQHLRPNPDACRLKPEALSPKSPQ